MDEANRQQMDKINALGLKYISKILSDGRDDNYYRKKIARGYIMSDAEIEIIDYINNNFDKTTIVCEPGTGFGQLPIVLSALGFKAIGLEIRADRIDGAIKLRKMYSKRYPLAARSEIVKGRYPQEMPDADLLLTFNFVSTFNKENKDHIIESFKLFKHTIIDTVVFGTRRDTEEERQELLRYIESFGFDSKQVFESFYLITRREHD